MPTWASVGEWKISSALRSEASNSCSFFSATSSRNSRLMRNGRPTSYTSTSPCARMASDLFLEPIINFRMNYAVVAVTFIHVVICFFLIIVVLLQSGKAADLAGAFGGMGSQTVFGPRGANTILSKATTVAAVLFMITALTLAIMSQKQGATVQVEACLISISEKSHRRRYRYLTNRVRRPVGSGARLGSGRLASGDPTAPRRHPEEVAAKQFLIVTHAEVAELADALA